MRPYWEAVALSVVTVANTFSSVYWRLKPTRIPVPVIPARTRSKLYIIERELINFDNKIILEGFLGKKQPETNLSKRGYFISCSTTRTVEVGMALWHKILRCGRQRKTTTIFFPFFEINVTDNIWWHRLYLKIIIYIIFYILTYRNSHNNPHTIIYLYLTCVNYYEIPTKYSGHIISQILTNC